MTPLPGPIRVQLEKILASKGFAHADRISRFLRFTVEQAIQGRGEQLKEYLLGIEVFDRKPSYDPRIDPIVRVEARRLRSKLQRYYLAEGSSDPVRIDLPKGSYVPVFRELEAAPEGPEQPRDSIAVLPFANLSTDQENEYFSDGLTEEILHALTKVEGLRVVAWNSAFQFKGKAQDISKVGEQLNVGVVLQGSVRKAGERLRVTAQLINVADGSFLWSETYQRDAKDVFAIQDEISRAIVDKLRIQLEGGTTRPLVKQHTGNLEAYNLYLRGRYCWNQRTEERLRKAVQYFEQAIAEDADFAQAYVGLADSYVLLAQYGALSPRVVMPKAKAAADRALAIDATIAEAHASLGLLRSLYDWDWREAERHYQLAIRLNPGCAVAHHWYAIDYLAVIGRLEEALAEIRRALELDPLSLIINTNLGDIFLIRRQHDLAIEQYQKTLELDPSFYRAYWDLGWAYEQKSMFQEAVAALQKARTLSGGSPSVIGDLGYCYALWGRKQEAQELLEELKEQSRRRHVSPVSMALIHFGLDQRAQGIQWLEKAYEDRDCSLVWLKEYPMYDRLRQDPDFLSLQKRTGLENVTGTLP